MNDLRGGKSGGIFADLEAVAALVAVGAFKGGLRDGLRSFNVRNLSEPGFVLRNTAQILRRSRP